MAVTLCVVIEHSLVTVTFTDAADDEPDATVLPRMATAYVHGAVAPVGVMVTRTRAQFVAAS